MKFGDSREKFDSCRGKSQSGEVRLAASLRLIKGCDAFYTLPNEVRRQRGRDALSGQHSALSVAKAGKGYACSRVVPRHRLPTD